MSTIGPRRPLPVLSARALQDVNDALPWFAATALPDGRIVGRVATRENKRDTLQPVPDKRIIRLHNELDLSDKRVLEVGCFEGIHTLGLLEFCSDVTAVDVRPINVIKTLARLSVHGRSARVFTLDIEQHGVGAHYDVIFHCGVLYHLEDPVTHLRSALAACDAIYLDTHIAAAGRDVDVAVLDGREYLGYRHTEGGWSDPFSGRAGSAFWLRREDIDALFHEAGFSSETWSERDERNGPRIGLLGRRQWSTSR
ncbi:class I SAM-dependent methyltransferase [Lysobacter xanthus]